MLIRNNFEEKYLFLQMEILCYKAVLLFLKAKPFFILNYDIISTCIKLSISGIYLL